MKECPIHDTEFFIEVVPGPDGSGEEKEYCPHCKIEELQQEIDSNRAWLTAEIKALRAQRDALKEALESLVDEADKARECLLSESLVGRFRYAARTRIAIDQAKAALDAVKENL
jgi:uncharacterized coiled-coil DUF342 family protein